MESEISQKLQEQKEKLDAIYQSVEKTRKYFLWTLIITLAVMILPLLGIIIVAPMFIDTLTSVPF